MLIAKNITKSYNLEGQTTAVLKDVSFSLMEGEFASITGRSGSGKSTLLNVLSTLVRPDKGELEYQGRNLAGVREKELNRLRNSDFSIIFQFHHLLPYLSVLENTLLPFMNSVRPVGKTIRAKAMECLKRVGLADKAGRLPGNLSGGEQQRVAIARALVKSSRILFADEPTGSLDKVTGESIMDLLSDLHADGLAIVMVTHEPEYAKRAQRTIQIEDGIILP